jgi:hypothetical protein
MPVHLSMIKCQHLNRGQIFKKQIWDSFSNSFKQLRLSTLLASKVKGKVILFWCLID